MNTDEVGSELREIRQRLNLSQEELASKLGVSFATVNRWETGKAKPQLKQREAITALGTSIEEATGATAGSEVVSGRRRRGITRSAVLSTRSMEQMLWDAAWSIRGEKDAPKFKDYLLPLLFIKRLSDVFDDEVARLADQFGSREAALTIVDAEALTDTDKRIVRFYIPPQAR